VPVHICILKPRSPTSGDENRHSQLVLTVAIGVLVSTAAHSAELVLPLGTLPAEAASVTDYYRQNVYDTAGQKIGEIVDILLEKQGQVPGTMISVGSFLSLTRKVVVIPFPALQVTFKVHEPYLVLDVDKRTLRSAPGFEFNRSARRWVRVEEEK
jgi:sporulation protein YlmC with PRC-barrel domain